MQDIRSAIRALARRPGFTAIAIATLAVGIGGNIAIFSVVDAALLRPLPYPRPERLVVPWEFSAELQQRTGLDRLPCSPGDVTDFRTRNRSFDGLAWMRADRVNLAGSGEPERLAGVRVSAEFFDVLGVQPIAGRGFMDSDAGSGRVALIGHGLWHRRFGADPQISGRRVTLNGEPATILGVLPRGFRFPSGDALPAGLGFATEPELWTLDTLTLQQQHSRGGKSFVLIGRLHDGVSYRAAEEDLAAIAADIARTFPASNAGWTVRIVSLREQLVGGVRPALLILLTAVGIVLLIGCVNVANLLLVRATFRHREMCIRGALGADRHRLVGQLLTESLLLAFLAGCAGLFVAWGGLRGLLVLSPAAFASVSGAALDGRIVGFTFCISVLTGVAFGIVPAFQGTRGEVHEGLRDGMRGTVGSRRARRTRSLLVVVEVALAVMLLVGALLLARTFVRLLKVDAGFQPEGVLTMEIALPRAIYPAERAGGFFERLTARLEQIPGIQAAGVTSVLPLTAGEHLRQVTIEGRPRPAAGREVIAEYRVVTPPYFRIMGVPHIVGESLPSAPLPGRAPVLLINATMAATCWPAEDPIGKRLKLTSFDQEAPWFTVAGVVGDIRHASLQSAARPQVYVHQRSDPSEQMVVVMRTAGDPNRFAGIARAAVSEIDSAQPVGKIRTMRVVVDESVSDRRFTMSLVGVFALLALVLCLVGLYAVVSHSVAERTQEMGVRLALGASPGDLRRLVLTEGLMLVGVGVGVGLTAAYIATRSMEALLFGVTARDATTFVSVPLIVFTAGVLGCLVPARRAMRVDPMTALREE
jgi:predicted permease